MSDPINLISTWFHNLLLGWGLSEGLVNFIGDLVGAGIVATVAMLIVILLIWVERKIAGRMQDRWDPIVPAPTGCCNPSLM